jgi:hypothetical protein
MTISASRRDYDESSKGRLTAGVASFAGVLLVIVAIFQVLVGIAAIANDSVFVSGVHYAYTFSTTAWGWVHLVLGVVALVVGIAIMRGQTVGYMAGILIAGLSAIASFAFLPYYPVWALLIVAFDVLVLWALCSQIAHDRVDLSDVEGPV